MRKSLTAVAAALAMSLSSAAGATIILDTTNTSGLGLPTSVVMGSGNDGGYSGSVGIGQLSVADDGHIRFEYLGKEAGYTNSLWLMLGPSLVFQTSGGTAFADPGTFSSWYSIGAGYLPFQLCTSGGLADGTYGRCANNASAASIAAQWNLGTGNGYRSIGYREESNGSWLIFWDDSGAGPDDDYDDLIARVYYRVPEPGTLALLGFGLAGLGFAGRRRKT